MILSLNTKQTECILWHATHSKHFLFIVRYSNNIEIIFEEKRKFKIITINFLTFSKSKKVAAGFWLQSCLTVLLSS